MQRKWKRHWQRLAKAILPPVTASLLFLAAYSPVLANPAGGTVISGSAAITSSGSTTTINQTTNKAVINWQSFSIGKGETVNFVQPGASSVALNRVIGSDASAIYGSLNANGKVYLINPNGILFSSGAQVNVGGLVASTLNISDSDFVSCKYIFQKDGSAGSVVNQGHITAANEAVLIGPKVANEGVIAAKVTGLAAGNKVSLDFSGDSLLNVAVDTGALNGSATNCGTITAAGGLVVMSAGTKDALLGTVINNSGVIRAQNVNNAGGVIRLEGNTVVSSGTLDASGKARGQTGGTVKLLGDTVTVKVGSSIDVSGDAGGGTALIGGNYQGSGSEYQAANTTVEQGTVITADAIASGNGGQVVVWAKDTTQFAGTISARGGSQSGDGGSVETSGKKTLKVSDSAKVITTAVNGKRGNWLLDPDDFTIGAAGDIDGYTLQVLLGTSDVTIKTTLSASSISDNHGDVCYGATGSGQGNITVDDALTWASGSTLTLSAYNSIFLNASITATSGGLTLAANTSGTTTGIIKPASASSISVGTFSLQSGTWQEVNSSLSGFYAKDFRLTGSTFIRAKGGSGTSASPYQIADVYGLQGVGSSGMMGKYYTLANNIDASGTQYWNYDNGTSAYLGFVPIGSAAGGTFSGSFDGSGHTISGLTIYRPSTYNVGLFGYSTGTISNVGLIGGSVTGSGVVGGLSGANAGTITNSYSTGAVSGSSDTVGGLVGANYAGGTITNSYSTGAVTGSSYYVGGLVGWNTFGSSIENSYSTGVVTGGDTVGGLVGHNQSTITNSYSTGVVTGGDTVGGLVGHNQSTITNSYSTGAVTSNRSGGGLVGGNNGTITNSYSTGAVTSSGNVGGLAGDNSGTITNSYSMGAVTGSGNDCTGGLVGQNLGAIQNSYSTGTVTGSQYFGGLVGFNNNGGITNSYWDVATSNQTAGVGYGNATGATGLTTAQMKQAASYSGWDISATGGSSSVWRMYDGYSYPLLRSFLMPLTVTITGGSMTYNGSAYTGATSSYPGIPDCTLLKGTLSKTYNGSAAAPKNAGSYTVSGTGFYSSQQGYDISYTPGTLTINKANITVSAVADTKTYDGTAASSLTPTASWLAAGDTLSGMQQYSDKNAGTGKTLTVTSYSINGGNGGNNYNVTAVNTNTGGVITPRPITITPDVGQSKVYGVADSAALTYTAAGGPGTSGSAIVSGDTLNGSLTRAAGSSVGNYLIEQGTLITANNSNYAISYSTTPVTFAITAQPSTPTTPSTPTMPSTPTTPITPTTPTIPSTPTVPPGVTGPVVNAAYNAAIVYVQQPTGEIGRPGLLSAYWSPVSGYMSGAAGSYVPLTILGINTDGYVPWTVLGSSGPIHNEPAKGVFNQ